MIDDAGAVGKVHHGDNLVVTAGRSSRARDALTGDDRPSAAVAKGFALLGSADLPWVVV